MATVLMRRSVAVATLAALATMGSPLVGSAFAAPFAATGITTNPAPDNNHVVPANRPTIVASFNDDVAPGSTVDLVEKGTATNLCGTSKISGKDVSCQPTADLQLGKTYQAVGHGKDGAGHKADTATFEFTVNYPKLTDSYPVDNGAIVNGDETLSATYDQEISQTPTRSTFKVFERLANGSAGNRLSGTTGYTSSSGGILGGTTDTITWTPDNALGAGSYLAVIHVSGVDGSGADNPAAYADTKLLFNVASAPPTGLTAPQFINNTNETKAPFSGNGPAGTTITVTVHGTATNVTGTNPSTASGTGDVPACPAVTSCPWKVEVDTSSLDDGTLTWTADATDGSGKSTATANGPSVVKDTTAPPTPDATAAQMAAGSSTLAVSATDTGTDVTGYRVEIVDEDNHKQVNDFPGTGQNMPTTNIDVTGLDDGQLTISTYAVDGHGNASNADFDSVTKNAGITVDFPGSQFAIGNAIVDFPTAAAHPVQAPAQVTLAFTEPITQSWQDNSGSPAGGGPTHRSTMCVFRVGSSTCLNGTSTVAQSDDRTLVTTLPGGLTDDDYSISYSVWPKHFCHDVSFTGSQNANCVEASGTVQLPDSTTDFVFTIDTAAPTVAITDITPDPIKAADVKNVSVTGTVDPGAATVQLVIKSSGGKGTRLATAAISRPAGGGRATWAAKGLNLSALPDGTLTVKATAKDDAVPANTSSDTATAKLKAHASRLTEHASDTKVTYGHAVTVSGRLTDGSGDGISKATITIAPKYGKGDFGKSVTAKTNADGHWSAILAPKHNATFFASYEGSDTAPLHSPAATHSARTLVHALVKITNVTGSAVSGKVRPNEKGKIVRVYRESSSGPVLLGKDALDKRSRFSVTAKVTAGTKIFATVGKTAQNLAGRSKAQTV